MILANKYQTQLREVIEVEEVTDEKRIEKLKTQGWKEVADTPSPIIDDDYHQLDYQVTEDENGDYRMTYSVVKLSKKIEQSIAQLKQQLADTDYKVVKNIEYQMAMMMSVEPNTIILDLYDAQELHNERQAIRDKINELETLLKE